MRLEHFVDRVGLHLGRGTWKRAAILAVVFLVGGLSAGCGTRPPLPPLNFTSDALRNSGKGVAVFGVQISDHIGIKVGCGPMTAILVPTEPTAAPRSVWAFGTLREPRGVVVLQTELPGGTYGVANITCKSGNHVSAGNGNPRSAFLYSSCINNE